MTAEHGLAAGFLAAVERTPDAPAVRLGTGSVCFAELHETALRWAGCLLDAVDRPKTVGVLADRGVTAYAGMLAALYAGAAVVPLNPAFPEDRTRRMLHAAGVQALLAESADHTWAVPVVPPGRGTARLTAPARVGHDDTAYILFTSGSTGRPKGVPISHGNVAHYFRHVRGRYGFGPGDVVAQTFDLTFDLAMFELFAAWDAGAAVVTVPATAYRDLPAFVTRHGLTVWLSTPSTIALARRFGGLPPRSMESLRWSLFCGEALVAADASRWQAAAPHSTLENLYGPTELTISCSAHRWSATSADNAVHGVVPIGTLHDGMDHLVIDHHRRPSVTGELCVTGPQMFPGYLDPRDDDGRFLTHGSRRWYRTGDRVGRTPDGELTFLGRVDDQVQVRGWRVEPAELEHRLRDSAGLTDAVVVAPVVDGTCVLVAFHTGAQESPGDLNSLLTRTIPRAMVPDHYIHLAELPRNRNKKVDRALLETRAADHLRSGAMQVVYAPERDGDPDPGEVVWGWVPYEDDPTMGKDRPVLVIGYADDAHQRLLAVPLSSKDPEHKRDAHEWVSVGEGGWDRERRESFANADRLLRFDAGEVRREGAALPRDRFDAVVAMVRELGNLP